MLMLFFDQMRVTSVHKCYNNYCDCYYYCL